MDTADGAKNTLPSSRAVEAAQVKALLGTTDDAGSMLDRLAALTSAAVVTAAMIFLRSVGLGFMSNEDTLLMDVPRRRMGLVVGLFVGLFVGLAVGVSSTPDRLFTRRRGACGRRGAIIAVHKTRR